MNVRILLLLTVAVLGIGAAAYYFGEENKAVYSEAFEPGPMFPGLLARVNDIDEARVESQEGGVVTLQKRDGHWAVAEQYGYRANPERVSGLLRKTAAVEKIEQKTAKPENHERLRLDDPAGENSLATRITLKAGETTEADIVVGLNTPADHGGGAFVRLWGEDQTWLTEGTYNPHKAVIEYLDRTVVNIDGRRMQSARIQHMAKDDGAVAEMVTISADAPDQEAYSLGAAIPEGGKPKPDHELSSVIRLPDFLVFEDVRPATEITGKPKVVAVYETFDGLRVTLSATEEGEATWVTLTADTVERAPGLDAFVTEHKGKDTDSGRIADQMKSAEEIAEEAEAIAAGAEGWAYKLTDYKTGRLTVATADVVEKPEAAAQQ